MGPHLIALTKSEQARHRRLVRIAVGKARAIIQMTATKADIDLGLQLEGPRLRRERLYF
jgi:hypothetical protein